jgi:hypothetical protein
MLREAVACGAFQKYTQTDLLPHYKRRATPHIKGSSYTFEKKKKGYTHFCWLLARFVRE